MQATATLEVVTDGDVTPSPEEIAAIVAAKMEVLFGLGYRVVSVNAVNAVTP